MASGSAAKSREPSSPQHYVDTHSTLLNGPHIGNVLCYVVAAHAEPRQKGVCFGSER